MCNKMRHKIFIALQSQIHLKQQINTVTVGKKIMLVLCYFVQELLRFDKLYSPGWSALYSESDPSSRRHRCRRERSCSVQAAEIWHETFREPVPTCLLSTVARHSACSPEKKSLEEAADGVVQRSIPTPGITRMTSDASSEMSAWNYTEIQPTQTLASVRWRKQPKPPTCQRWECQPGRVAPELKHALKHGLSVSALLHWSNQHWALWSGTSSVYCNAECWVWGVLYRQIYLNGDSDEEERSSQCEVRPVSHHQDEALIERDLLLCPWGVRIWNSRMWNKTRIVQRVE